MGDGGDVQMFWRSVNMRKAQIDIEKQKKTKKLAYTESMGGRGCRLSTGGVLLLKYHWPLPQSFTKKQIKVSIERTFIASWYT